MTEPTFALETQQLSIRFGGLTAVSDVNIRIPQKKIWGLIGPNGAGKTTFFNLITGVYKPTFGNVQIFGKRSSHLPPHLVTRNLQTARTFQNIRLFKELTVFENVLIACDQAHQGLPLWHLLTQSTLWQTEKIKKEQLSSDLLGFFELGSRASALAGSLPYGEQRRLEIARALATGCKLLLLDEPAAGLNTTETAQLTQTIRNLRDQFQVTVLLIEHDMKLVMNLCEQITVLDYGRVIAEGAPQDIRSNPRVIEAYLGKEVPQ